MRFFPRENGETAFFKEKPSTKAVFPFSWRLHKVRRDSKSPCDSEFTTQTFVTVKPHSRPPCQNPLRTPSPEPFPEPSSPHKGVALVHLCALLKVIYYGVVFLVQRGPWGCELSATKLHITNIDTMIPMEGLTVLDDRQITHLICARLKHDLYDFLRGVF